MRMFREYGSVERRRPAGKSQPRVAARVLALIATTALAWIGLAAGTARIEAAAQDSRPAKTPAANAENGKRLFVKDGCYQCHNRNAQGATGTGPKLGPNPLPLQVLILYVRNPTGEMPPYTAKVMSDQDLADIHAFLESLPHPPDPKSIPLLKDLGH